MKPRIMLLVLVFLMILCYPIQVKAITHPPLVPPALEYPSEFDKNHNLISDGIDQQIQSLLLQNKSSEKIPVIIDLSEPVTDKDISDFKALGGEVGFVYRNIAYGWSGTLPAGQFNQLATQYGKRLFFVSPDLPGQMHLDKSMQLIRARPVVWNKGYSGDASLRVAVLDSGIDFSHPDLQSKEVYWYDAVPTESYSKSTDLNGHGTFVSGIICGTGSAYGTNTYTQLTTTFTNKLPNNTNSGYFDVLDITTTGTMGLKMYFTGTGTAQLSSRNTANAWMHYINSGSSPFSWSTTISTTGLYKPFAGNVTGLGNQPYSVIESFPYIFTNDSYNYFRGAASGSYLAGIKVFDVNGAFSTSWVLAGMDTTLSIKSSQNIVVANFSGGLFNGASDASFRNKANTMVANGIILVVSAGNDYPSYTIPDPGLAAKAITVGAVNYSNRMTNYSSNGAPGSGKPDVVAPGGGGFDANTGYFETRQIIAPDTNHDDAHTASFTDKNLNDYRIWNGTSFAAPHVAGVAVELIQAWGTGYVADESHALKIKGLLLMTAYETNTTGELYSGNNPTLNRGGKDNAEGYGRINADAAIEALTQSFTINQNQQDSLGSNAYDKKVWACKTRLPVGVISCTLQVPAGADYDLYLYSWNVDSTGEPILLGASTSASIGNIESITYTASSSTLAHFVIKWVSGNGKFKFFSSGPSLNIHTDTNYGNAPFSTAYNGGRRIVRDGKGILHAVYSSDSDGDGTSHFPSQIFYSYATAPGTTSIVWSTPVNISKLGGPCAFPSIAIDSSTDRLYVVWMAQYPGGDYDIWFSTHSNVSSDNTLWTNAAGIWETTASEADSYYPVVSVTGDGVVHVAWQQMAWESGYSEILYAQSRNQGTTWVNTANLPINLAGGPISWPDNVSNTPPTSSQMPTIATNMNYQNNQIHISWNDDSSMSGSPAPHIWYRRNNGPPLYLWSTTEDVSASIPSGMDGYPCIAVDKNETPHLAWMHYVLPGAIMPNPGGYQSIYYSRRTGNVWLSSPPENTIAQNSIDNEYPSITIQSHLTLDVAWSLSTSDFTDHEIFYRQNPYNSTATTWSVWSAFINLTQDPDQSDFYPSLAFQKSGSWNSKEWRGMSGIATDDGYNLLWSKGNINPFGIWHRGTDNFISTSIIDWYDYAP